MVEVRLLQGEVLLCDGVALGDLWLLVDVDLGEGNDTGAG